MQIGELKGEGNYTRLLNVCRNKMASFFKPPSQGFTNANMQIRVKKVFFLQNPNTISKGLEQGLEEKDRLSIHYQ